MPTYVSCSCTDEKYQLDHIQPTNKSAHYNTILGFLGYTIDPIYNNNICSQTF